MPFDWLITPLSSIPLVLQDGFKRMVDPSCLEPIEIMRRGRPVTTVINRCYQVLIPHEFPEDGERSLAANWRDHLPEAAAKWDYLARRWRDMTAIHRPILFVRQGGNLRLPSKTVTETSAQDHLMVLEALRSVAKNCRLLVVDPGCDLSGTDILTDSLGEGTAQDRDKGEDAWMGPPEAWARVLARFRP